jgi:6-phosphogluconate dehydrogenase
VVIFFFPDVKTNTAKIGFIGLGNMGSPMARNVLAKVINYSMRTAIEVALFCKPKS